MVSNTYDEPTSSAGSIGDPAMLWISPIEQVIKEINFSTYADGTDKHFMNILTLSSNANSMQWIETIKDASGNDVNTDRSRELRFYPLMGNPNYSYARIEINNGSHHLQGAIGFLAHVYGFGERCSYAYSCGSSTIQRSVTFNGTPLMLDSIYSGKFCVNEPIEMKLNIGNNDYESIVWDYGDGVTYASSIDASNEEKKQTTHTYTVPGWYDLKVAAVYINQCTGTHHNEEMRFSFRVVRADTIFVAPKDSCLTLEQQAQIIADHGQAYLDSLVEYGGRTILNPDAACYEDKQLSFVKFGLETETVIDTVVRDGAVINDNWYDASTTINWTVSQPHKCDQHFTCNLTVITCLDISVLNNPAAQHICPGENLEIPYIRTKGNIASARFIVPEVVDGDAMFDDMLNNSYFTLPTASINKAGIYHGQLIIDDLYCDSIVENIDFTVYYPSNIFQLKFNNVLAVYKDGFGGNNGYEFTGYQWYRNHEPIEGATESILYLGQNVTFEYGDTVFVMLTDKDGLVLPSCEQILTDIPDFNPEEEEAAPARKMIINRQFVIKKGEDMYDIYGQRVR